MDLLLMEKLLFILGAAVYAVLIVRCVQRLSFRRSMAPVFFTFGLVSCMMSGLYWLAFDFLRQQTRIPFAANVFGEIGYFLLLAASLNVVFRGRFGAARREIVGAAVFTACSTALWIAWSGAVVEDLLVGVCFGYLLCVCVRSLKQSGILSRVEWGLLAGYACVVLLLQGLTFVLPKPWNTVADYCAYAVLFTALLSCLGKLIRAVVRKRNPAGQFALAVSCEALAISTMYMSAGLFYLAAQLIMTLTLPLALVALRREEAES